MALANDERVGKALELLRAGLGPFVERGFQTQYGGWPRRRRRRPNSGGTDAADCAGARGSVGDRQPLGEPGGWTHVRLVLADLGFWLGGGREGGASSEG